MRINRLELIWFRGAAESGILDAGSKSVVVYGANASGKSTFVDGVEYITRNGRICHLQHEYSGFYQEKGVRNTSAPSIENTCMHPIVLTKSILFNIDTNPQKP